MRRIIISISILSAIYSNKGIEKEYSVREITKELYHKTLRGHLFCPTPGCNARIVYNSGLTPYFKTWKMDNHIEECLHYFDRENRKSGVNTEDLMNVELSVDRKKRAMKEALKLYNMTAEEKAKQSGKSTKRNPKTQGKKNNIATRPVLKDGENEEIVKNEGVRGPNLLKRPVSTLQEKDEGQTRLVIGVLKNVNDSNKGTSILIEDSGKELYLVFEEVFRVNSPEYLGLFHHLEKYQTSKDQEDTIIITAVGQIRKSKSYDGFESSVFYGRDLEIDGIDLRILAMQQS
ncbi:hypothetical protein [Salibacterium halotolerans]|uniref:hypothetical protein n=1 Tax=Salibacterium halotolerans TaxID=1884432 RepID=UPI0011133BEA|nr:hypothetical protein [Salibacterium halotolerans]